MLLTAVLDELTAERPVARITEDQYRRSLRCFSAFLGRPAETTDLQVSLVNRWLRHRSELGASPVTVKNRKRGLTPIWNYAAERGWAPGYETKRLRRIECPPPLVQPWTLDQVGSLVDACADFPGQLSCGVSAGRMMEALVWLAFETGTRPSDWRRLRWDQVDMQAQRVQLIQHKTRKPHVAAISDTTVAALERIEAPPRDLVCPLTKSGLYRWERLLLKHANESHGLGRRKGEGLGVLRKSHATTVCEEHGLEAAARSLGHVSGTMIAARHYVAAAALSNPIVPRSPLHGRTRGRDSGRPAA